MSDARKIQHMDDIEIPAIEITEGWVAADISTLEEYEDAFAYLMAAVAQIEFQIDVEHIKPAGSRDELWLARARCALKYKKAALQIAAHQRGRITDNEKRGFQSERDRVLLDHIKSVTTPKQFQEWVIGSGVESMAREKVAA